MAIKFFGGKQKKFYAELDESPAADAAAKEASAPAAPSPAEPVATPAPEASTAKPVDSPKKSKKKTVKSQKAAPAPVVAPVVSKPKLEPTEVAFASKNVLTPTLVRRRPGPSLDVFKAIAKEISPRR